MRLMAAAAIASLAAVFAAAAFAAPSGWTPPHWLLSQEQTTLARVFGGARPTRIDYLPYPKKIAVVFIFNRVVICEACSAPSTASLPRGRVIRLSYDRQTHRITGAYQFCEARASYPPRAACLRR